VHDHDGAIRVESEIGRGTLFEVLLPVSVASMPAATADLAASPQGKGEWVLVVDDEPAVARALDLMVRQAGYTTSVHTSPMAALEDFRRRPDAFALVLTDLTMPGMRGPELAAQLHLLRPDVPVVMATGFGGAWTPSPAEAAQIRKIIHKPFDPRLSPARSTKCCTGRRSANGRRASKWFGVGPPLAGEPASRTSAKICPSSRPATSAGPTKRNLSF